MKNTYSLEIDAAPEQVFLWLDDNERLLEWLPNIVENENLEVTDNKVGSTFRQVYVENGRRMEMHGKVTAHEPNRRIRCEITGDSFDLDVDYLLEDLGGRTRLTQYSEVHMKGFFKIVGFLMGPFMKKASSNQADGSFNKLKQLVEAENH